MRQKIAFIMICCQSIYNKMKVHGLGTLGKLAWNISTPLADICVIAELKLTSGGSMSVVNVDVK
jgi:fumarate hydratase class II